jgi:hypothetical protein
MKFAAAILIDFWMCPLHRARIHRRYVARLLSWNSQSQRNELISDRHNISARYHPPPVLQKYQLKPELFSVPQEVLLKISGSSDPIHRLLKTGWRKRMSKCRIKHVYYSHGKK